MNKKKQWCIYMLQCGGNRLYTGMTNDVGRRFEEHRSGKGCRFTRAFGVKKLMYMEEYSTKQSAMKREAQIKGLTRKNKLELIKNKSKENDE